MTLTRTITLPDVGAVELQFTEHGDGDPYLVLHGGAGPLSVAGFADLLAERQRARVITPTHPGFAGTIRPDGLRTTGQLAELYAALLNDLDLTGVTVLGNSVGGWIAAEMGIAGSMRLKSAILVDAVGIEVPDHPVADFFSLTLDQVAEYSYHDPEKFRIDPAKMPPAQLAAMPGNRAALAVYGGGPSMIDPTLRDRLESVRLPVLVLWGESDRIADPEYGRAFAEAIPGARFELLPGTGHVPQVETPELLISSISGFVDSLAEKA
jgi:pimeloyl-ACP methyl ester carboxylesterase